VKIDLLVSLAIETHAVRGLKNPVTVRVVHFDFVDNQTERNGPRNEGVVLVAKMDAPYIASNSTKDRRQKRDAKWSFKFLL
jgi:hypothetical protein